MNEIENSITRFNGKTFSSNEDVCSWLREELRAFRGNGIQEGYKKGMLDCLNRWRQWFRQKSNPKKTMFQRDQVETFFHHQMKNMESDIRQIKNGQFITEPKR